jgi:hypothetical protein
MASLICRKKKVTRRPARLRALHAADARIKSLADSNVNRAYRTDGPWGTPMDIVERFYIAAAVLSFMLIAAMALL